MPLRISDGPPMNSPRSIICEGQYRIDNISTMSLISPGGLILWRGNASDASSAGPIEDAQAGSYGRIS